MLEASDDDYISVLVEIMRDQTGHAVDEQLTFLVAPCDMIADSLAQVGRAAAAEDDRDRNDGLRTDYAIAYLHEVSSKLMERLLRDLRDPNYRAQWESDDLLLLLSQYRAGALSESDEGFRQRLIAFLPAEVERVKKARASESNEDRQEQTPTASTMKIANQSMEGA
jgi:hypothetical protein